MRQKLKRNEMFPELQNKCNHLTNSPKHWSRILGRIICLGVVLDNPLVHSSVSSFGIKIDTGISSYVHHSQHQTFNKLGSSDPPCLRCPSLVQWSTPKCKGDHWYPWNTPVDSIVHHPGDFLKFVLISRSKFNFSSTKSRKLTRPETNETAIENYSQTSEFTWVIGPVRHRASTPIIPSEKIGTFDTLTAIVWGVFEQAMFWLSKMGVGFPGGGFATNHSAIFEHTRTHCESVQKNQLWTSISLFRERISFHSNASYRGKFTSL